MEKIKNLKIKPLIYIFFILVIIASFVFLKLRDFSQSRIELSQKNDNFNVYTDSVFNNKKSGNIKKFNSFEDLSLFLEDSKSRISQSSYRYSSLEKSEMPLVDFAQNQVLSEDSSGVDSSGMGASSDFSSTNIQVEGVDEADIVKTDGKYLYIVSNQDVYIVDAYPAETAKVLSKISLEAQINNIYIKDDKLIIFGQKSSFAIMEKMALSSAIWPGPYNDSSFLKIYDINDKSNPLEKRNLEIEGAYFNSRMIGDHLYFVVNNYNFQNVMPRVTYQGNDLSFDCKDGSKCLNADVYYFDAEYNSFNFTSIFSINIKNDQEEFKSSFYLMPGGQNMYVSLENIYLSYTKYLNEYEIESELLLEIVYDRLSEKDKETIVEINKVSDKILSIEEKKIKIRSVIDIYLSFLSPSEIESLDVLLKNKVNEKYPNLKNELETTIIYKLAIFNGIIEPVANGVVSGSVLNQFSMDEYQSYFRLATTKNNSWSRYLSEVDLDSYNNVYTLDSDMQIAGRLEGLAPGERIYSVRFLSDKAYVVTFKQVDPLFAIDLKNPYEPIVLGELKIPGFSNYLHPYGENKLLGFGQNTEVLEGDRLINSGLKLSLFDTSNNEPLELDSYIIGSVGSYSIALYDHHAFLASEDKNIIVVPATLTESNSDSWGKTNFDGFLVFEIIDNKINLKGKISNDINNIKNFDDFLYYSAKRSLFIDNNLYSIFNKSVKINKIEDLSEISTIELK